jgi:molybdate transport system permease protein
LLALTGVAFYALPLAGLAAQAPWSDAVKLVHSPAALQALRLSLIASTAATLLSLLIGGPLAFVLARVRFPGRGLVRGLVVLPMVLPPVVAGVGLLTALGRRGLLGETLYAAGISLPFTTAAAIVAAAFVASPFLVITLEAGLRSVDRRLEDAAATLGASRLRILATVTVPALLPSLVAGASLCWARALGEFGATVIFAGNLQGVTQTGPLAVYQALQTGDFEGAVFLSLILFALSLVVLVLLRGRVGAG